MDHRLNILKMLESGTITAAEAEALLEALEAEPAKKWRFVVEKAIYFMVAAVVGFFLAKFGL